MTTLLAEPASADAELIRLGQELQRELALLPELAGASHKLYVERPGTGLLSDDEHARWMAGGKRPSRRI
ncbi:hypothetical protein ACG873_01380 (plasmid) [Mesorhizobium sp. AaZ16]|uniref:hypothetical protein n=1 Tax=Mesorhizobium sp. AaZ16 TaxID=3402289 RepID=UPI00374F9E3E